MKITKDMKVKEVKQILDDKMISHSQYSPLVIGMMLQNFDYIEVDGYGHTAKLKLVTE